MASAASVLEAGINLRRLLEAPGREASRLLTEILGPPKSLAPFTQGCRLRALWGEHAPGSAAVVLAVTNEGLRKGGVAAGEPLTADRAFELLGLDLSSSEWAAWGPAEVLLDFELAGFRTGAVSLARGREMRRPGRLGELPIGRLPSVPLERVESGGTLGKGGTHESR